MEVCHVLKVSQGVKKVNEGVWTLESQPEDQIGQLELYRRAGKSARGNKKEILKKGQQFSYKEWSIAKMFYHQGYPNSMWLMAIVMSEDVANQLLNEKPHLKKTKKHTKDNIVCPFCDILF